MDIVRATTEYEAWMAQRITIIPADLARKHRAMADATSAFPFLRATFYRWAQRFPTVCPDLATAPALLAVGDLHVENFGTWLDAQGRLVWGVNDFDEAHTIPYANDLVRLAVSANLARAAGDLRITLGETCDAILSGYTECLKQGGKPVVLAEDHHWLRALALHDARDPATFWAKMIKTPVATEPVPHSARAAMESLLPDPRPPYSVAHRVAGLGSLGRQRYLALADWRGGKVAREAKALLPSAWTWANRDDTQSELRYQDVLNRAVRSPDPFVVLRGEWIVRRLAPDCFRIELDTLPTDRDEGRLLHAMGWETGNVHLGSAEAIAQVTKDVQKRPRDWLRAAATAMTQETLADWRAWRAGNTPGTP